MTPLDSKDSISTMKLQYRQQSATMERYLIQKALVSFECGTLLRGGFIIGGYDTRFEGVLVKIRLCKTDV